jgi:hypothetical protein
MACVAHDGLTILKWTLRLSSAFLSLANMEGEMEYLIKFSRWSISTFNPLVWHFLGI